jgi:hypothetical protein
VTPKTAEAAAANQVRGGTPLASLSRPNTGGGKGGGKGGGRGGGRGGGGSVSPPAERPSTAGAIIPAALGGVAPWPSLIEEGPHSGAPKAMIRYPGRKPTQGGLPPTPDYAWPTLDTPQIVSGFRSSPPRERQEAVQKRAALAGGGGGVGAGTARARVVKSAGSADLRSSVVGSRASRSPRPKQHTFQQTFAPRRLPAEASVLSASQAAIVGRPTALLSALAGQDVAINPLRPTTAPAAPEAEAIMSGGRVMVRNAFALPASCNGSRPTTPGGVAALIHTPGEAMPPPPNTRLSTPTALPASLAAGVDGTDAAANRNAHRTGTPGGITLSLGAPAGAPASSRPVSRPGSAKGAPAASSRTASRPGSGGPERTPMPQGVSGVTVTSRPGSAARQQQQQQLPQAGAPPTPNVTPMKA